MLEDGAESRALDLLVKVAKSAANDPFLGECIAQMAQTAGEPALAEIARRPARAAEARAQAMTVLDESELREASRAWVAETSGSMARAFALTALARVWHRFDRLDMAVEMARRAVALDPDYPRARATLSRIEAERGNLRDAALLSAGTKPPAVVDRAGYLARAGDRQSARPLAARIEQGPPELLWRAAEVLRMTGDAPPDVLARLEQTLDRDPDAAMRILETASQATGGDHRLLNVKDGLQRLLRRRGATDLQPETYVLPDEILAAAARLRGDPHETWMLKPARLFGGKGMSLVAGPAAADALASVRGPWVLQRYVTDPLLVDGHKAHLRAYMLIIPGPPRAVFVSRDGIVRLAPRPWHDGGGGAVERHITNTYLHWDTGELEIEADETQAEAGHVRRLGAVLRRLSTEVGVDLHARLAGFARSVVGAVFPELDAPCAGLIAMDLILDQAGRFHLLEIESRPQFVAGGVPVVGRIHRDLGGDAWPILTAYLRRNDTVVSVRACGVISSALPV
jgi:tetratricopeptide (TPR) repeat protein